MVLSWILTYQTFSFMNCLGQRVLSNSSPSTPSFCVCAIQGSCCLLAIDWLFRIFLVRVTPLVAAPCSLAVLPTHSLLSISIRSLVLADTLAYSS